VTDHELTARLARFLRTLDTNLRKAAPFGAACVIPRTSDEKLWEAAEELREDLRPLLREWVRDLLDEVLTEAPPEETPPHGMPRIPATDLRVAR
jgi:hypothetical protein